MAKPRVPPVPTVDAAERARVEAAYARLGTMLTELADALGERMHERCPYRARDERCTFAGGCRNQRRAGRGAARTVSCGGDHQLRRTGD
ncbi:MAG: hypothetical protein FJ363_03175 [Gemmatimonadetes bacterium]|nr:hypothetical protein [Gemmatimonadota bacterium]